jgi:hypothetical protein
VVFSAPKEPTLKEEIQMTTAVAKPVPNLNEIAAAWREARRIYPVYAALIRQFKVGVAPNADLESPINRAQPEVLAKIARWFDEVDSKSEVWQLRQTLQTSSWVSDDQLRSLIRRFLAKPNKNDKVRDKVDYLLVQYYSHLAPEEAHNQHVSFAHVAELLGDLVGEADAAPAVAQQLEKILEDLNACAGLKDLLDKKVIDRARAIKQGLGADYFQPASLIATALFNFKMRLGFFRLMHAELHFIRAALHVMESRGQSYCDAKSAGMPASTPLSDIRNICHDWRSAFRAAYGAAVNFEKIIALRIAVEAAAKAPAPAAPSAPTAMAPAAQASAPVETAKLTPERVAKAAEATMKMEAVSTPRSLSIEDCIEQIAERLLHATIKNAQVTNLMFGDVKILLASWEVQAYTHGGDEVADCLQRAVAARVALNLAINEKKAGRLADIGEHLSAAHVEAAQIQERIAEAKENKNIDAAVNLAATAKRLLAMAAEAEK